MTTPFHKRYRRNTTCLFCEITLPEEKRAHAKYCNAACKQGFWRLRQKLRAQIRQNYPS
jgi:hypothetical protein